MQALGMKVTVVGEDVPPQEFEQPGWIQAHKTLKKTKEHLTGNTAEVKGDHDAPAVAPKGTAFNYAPRRPRKRAPPPPPLPDDDYKIIIRPRDGLNLRSWCAAQISDSVRKALNVSEETTAADTVQLNYSQNTILVSTPDEGRAAAYAGIAGILLGETQYEVRPYVTAPNNTAKGIVRGVPDYDTQEVIMRSLEQNDPQVLYARRLGNTSAIIVLFEGTAVPHYIKYRGTIMRCVLYKKKIEVCDTCLRTGHRKDVCPTPNVKKCHKCGLQDPLDGHECKAKCAVCGGPHETRSNDCRRRFATPPIVRQ